jgi:hypothetical protein
MFRRFSQIKLARAMGEKGEISLIASTDAPVSMGMWREVLKHDAGCVDCSSTSALLINHDANQIAGPVRNISFQGGQALCDAEILAEARCESGVTVRDAVGCQALRGVSIGYDYQRSDAHYDEQTRTVTVNKWRLLEVSLTPIPADGAAGIRSLPFDLSKENTMADPVVPAPAPAPAVPDVASIRAAVQKEAGEIGALAKSLGLDASEFVSMDRAAAKDAMLAEVAKRNKPPAVVSGLTASVTVDEIDKHRDALVDAYVARVYNEKPKGDSNPYAGRSLRGCAQRFARAAGAKTEDWSNKDAAHFALGEMSQVRDAANVTVGSFPSFVFLNAITKITAKGLEDRKSTRLNSSHT